MEHHTVGSRWGWGGRKVSQNAGTEIGDAQVGELPLVVCGDSRTDTGDTQVGGWNFVLVTAGTRVSGSGGWNYHTFLTNHI